MALYKILLCKEAGYNLGIEGVNSPDNLLDLVLKLGGYP